MIQLLAKQLWLRCRSSLVLGPAPGYAHDAEDFHLRKCSAGYEHPQDIAMKVGGSELHASVNELKQVVCDDAFDLVIVAKPEANPQAVELGPAKKALAFRLERLLKLTNKIDSLSTVESNAVVFAIEREDIHGVGPAQQRRIEISFERTAVEGKDDYFFVRRGCSTTFHRATAFRRTGCC